MILYTRGIKGNDGKSRDDLGRVDKDSAEGNYWVIGFRHPELVSGSTTKHFIMYHN